MDKKDLHPDPVDYQIIQFSNCMQMLACVCNMAAMVVSELRELAQIIDCVAEVVERIVSGKSTLPVKNKERKSGAASGIRKKKRKKKSGAERGDSHR